jgi:hypothetical protein
MEQLSFWNQVQIRNIIEIKNPRNRTDFEFHLMSLGIQTFLEKSDKFPKILICLIEYEFRLAWLYGKIKVSIHVLLDLF